MRIAVWNNLPSGGGQRALHDQVQGLLAQGHHIEMWSTDRSDRTLLDLEGLAPHHRVPLAPVRYPFSRRLPNPVDFYVQRRIGAMDQHCQEVARQIHLGGFDLVLASTCQDFAASRLGRFLEIPRVLYLQEPDRRLFEDPDRLAIRRRPRSPRGAFDGLMDMIMLRRASQQMREEIESATAFDQILVNSKFSAESVRRCYGLPSRVCYLGVDLGAWQCVRAPEHSVVSIGTLQSHKRPELVIDALSMTTSPHPELHWIANSSEPDYRRAVIEHARARGVSMTIHEKVDQTTMLEVLGSATLLVYAPLLEPFGYAPLECAAAGMTTVAVAQGGIRETVAHLHTGLLVQDDPSELAEAIDTLFCDETLRHDLEAAAYRTVSAQWNATLAAARLEHELERVVRRSA